jgi:hypothetical protein
MKGFWQVEARARLVLYSWVRFESGIQQRCIVAGQWGD